MNSSSSKINFTLTVINGGLENFDDLNPSVKILKPNRNSVFKKIKTRALKRNDVSRFDYISKFLKEYPQDLILLNTLLSLKHIDPALMSGFKTILYVHETEDMLVNLNKDNLKFLIEKVDLILCSSSAVKEYLEILGRKKQLEVLYPVINFQRFNLPLSAKNKREELGYKDTDFIWMMSGALLVNKNPKAFINSAKSVVREFPDAKFLWVGATDSHAYEIFLRNFISKNGLESTIKIIPRLLAEYYQYLNVADGFLLTSFSESFSMAALEATAFNKPVISFPCGGVLESVPANRREVTSNFSVDELVNLMKKEMNSEKKDFDVEDIQHLLKKDKQFSALNFKKIVEKVCQQKI
ncbi:glycosyltransferase [Salinimicrobium gaetbulicola]|uniref:Glycosyltransferase n=1 Tax=Salinimicrobium gaetbulicola TaxID=999702 RepID=A0ABW3IIU1_9FLAO